ncbi:DUF4381 domain-containing protein [Alteromonas sp. ASW11-36]|uniref:DUF4381 domain-containing protein n=1 Tax=Alteromonas arenosi TaxID=3055817 RepID=A0ABT7SUX9_9ALTE|nr:DUF4381 domain-containing protein [Alteromonas sp. ASW11-36]MDM7859991.1 DUF4381 domain-containing protein [Alteromonas sp. ASW11-36]
MDPLAQLHDIALAEPTGWWPLAWGWWVLIAASIALLILTASILMRRFRMRKPLRQAQRNLTLIIEQAQPARQQIEQINQLLKACSIHYFAASNPGKLYGQPWVDFLSAQLPQRQRSIFLEVAQEPLVQLFQTQQFSASQARAVATAADLWLNHVNLGGAKHV